MTNNRAKHLLLLAEDVGVSGISDGDHGHAVELTASSAELGVVAGVVVDNALGKHGVVLNLGLAKRRSVTGDQDHLGLVGAESLDGGLVSEGGLTGLHHELNLTVDGLNSLLGLLTDLSLNGGHCKK